MKAVLINLDKDTERLKVSLEHLGKFGIRPERIPGVLNEEPWLGFSLAMINALESIKNEEQGLIFEDDVLLEGWTIPFLPDGWDMLYFGANLQGEIQRINNQLVKVSAAWTTHAIMYSKQGVNKILNQYTVDKGIYDDWLRREFNKDNNCYMITPMLAYQRPSYSQIQGEVVDYREAMDYNYNKYVQGR